MNNNPIFISLNGVFNGTSEAQRQEAQATLNQMENENPAFILQLLQLQTQYPSLQLQCLLLIKNVIKRKWMMYVQNSQNKRVLFITKEIKIQIKERILISYVSAEQQSLIKKEFELILIEISSHDYPFNFPALVQYVSSLLIDQQLSLNQLVLLKNLFKKMPKNQSQNEQLQTIWPMLLSQYLKIDQTQLENSIVFDKLMVYFILSYNTHSISDQASLLFIELLKKTANLINSQVDCQKNRNNLIKMMSNIQDQFPLHTENGLQDYLTLLNMQLKIDQKSSIIGLIRILKTNSYFCTTDIFVKQNKSKSDEQKNILCNLKQKMEQIVGQYFANNTSNMLDTIIQLMSQPQNDITIEEQIEQEEDNDFNQLMSPYQSPLYILCLVFAELLIFRYPQHGFMKIKLYLEQIQELQYQVNHSMLESLLAIVGLMPKLSLKLKIELPFQIIPVIQYLYSQPTLHRRLMILSNRLLHTLNPTEMMEIVKMAIQLIGTSNDTIVQYQSLMCVRTLTEQYTQPIQWTQVLECVTPYIVQLLQNFTKPSVVQPLIQLLQQLIEKCSNDAPEYIIQAIEKSKLIDLMMTRFQESNQNQLLIDELCEMIKTLIVAIPSNIPIFQLALTLIGNNIATQPPKTSILSLMLFIVQEYDSQFDLQILLQLYNVNRDQLLSNTDSTNIAILILFIEELMILGKLNDTQFYIEIIESIYPNSPLTVKNACLNLSTTIMLLMMNQNLPLYGFQNLIQFFLDDFLKPQFTEKLETNFKIELQLTSILNRFIIQDNNGFAQFLNQFNITPDVYISYWMKNTVIIESIKGMKLNVLALASFLKHISSQTFNQFLDQILGLITQYFNKITNQNSNLNNPQHYNNPKYRLGSFRASLRKGDLRNNHMYDDVNLELLLKNEFKAYAFTHGIQDQRILSLIN